MVMLEVRLYLMLSLDNDGTDYIFFQPV